MSRTYHHGDLRSALVEAGLKALEATEIEDLSLRQLARDVGVSATAVYRHFPDKRALFSALADAGIDRLFEAQDAAVKAAAPGDAFAATGRAYVRFALANPALFRLTFAYSCRTGPSVFGNSRAALMLQDYAAQIAPNPDDARQLVMQAWSLVHGLAMLMLDGQLPAEDALIDRVIDTKKLFGR